MKLPINQAILPWPSDTEPALEPSPNGFSGSINMLREKKEKEKKVPSYRLYSHACQQAFREVDRPKAIKIISGSLEACL